MRKCKGTLTTLFLLSLILNVSAQEEETLRVEVEVGSLQIESEQHDFDLVDGTVLTINGAMHISPDINEPPTPFNQEYLQDYLLWVQGGIVAKDIIIADPEDWADFVFDENYELRSLIELETFVKENKHLPGIPGIKELEEKNHYTIHRMLVGQLQNVEELVLHTIAQEKKIQALREELRSQGELIDLLESKVKD